MPAFGPGPAIGAVAGPPGGGANQLAIASLFLGGFSVLSTLCCCIPLVGMVAYVVVPLAGAGAIATGVMGLQHANRTGGSGKTEAIIGIVLGGVGVMIGLVGLLLLALYGGAAAYGIMTAPPAG